MAEGQPVLCRVPQLHAADIEPVVHQHLLETSIYAVEQIAHMPRAAEQ